MGFANDAIINVEQEKAKLRGLIATDGKKRTSNPESRAAFTDAWLKIVRQVGLNDEAVEILFDGLNIVGARPWYLYILDTDGNKSYQALVLSKRAMANKAGETFRLMLNLFSLQLLTPVTVNQLDDIAKRLRPLSRNKKRKTWGEFTTMIRKHLLQPLMGQTINERASIHKDSALLLQSLLGDILEKIPTYGNATDAEREAITNLVGWLEEQTQAGLEAVELSPQPSVDTINALNPRALATPSESDEDVHTNSSEKSVEASGPSKDQCGIVVERSNEGDAHNDVRERRTKPAQGRRIRNPDMANVIRYLRDYQTSYECLATEYEQLQSVHEETLEQVARLKKDLESARREIEGLQTQRLALSGNYSELQKRLDLVEEENARVKEDLVAAEDMLTMLEASNAHKSDVESQKMVRELRFEYKQYEATMADEMDSDLGEVMRDVLGNVFAILRSNGIEL